MIKYNVYGGEGKCIQGFGGEAWRKELQVDLAETAWKGMDWIHLAHEREEWWVVVSTVMNFRILYDYTMGLFS